MKLENQYERSYDFDEAIRKILEIRKYGNMTFYNFVKLHEKMGIFARVGYNDDVFHISKIVNKLLEKIKNAPDLPYDIHEFLDCEFITISYKPTENCTTWAKVSNNTDVIIYIQVNNENELDVKYTIIHELLHLILIIRSQHAKDNSFFVRLQSYLRNSNISNNDLEENTRYFLYLIYRELLFEIYAWSNDAYIAAYKYKMQHPKKTNGDIMKYVMQTVYMTNKHLNNAITAIKSDDTAYSTILNILFSLFSEIGGNSGQSYFDKTVFELPIIQQLKFTTSRILKKYNKEIDIAKYILKLKEIYKDLLLEVKDIITDSFIEHLKYWHKQACLKLGKAILLGIADATIN